jgi:hypothetical protein
MPHPSRTIVIANSLTLTATPSTPTYINLPEAYTAFDGFVKAGTVSGTSPTLDITIDKGIRTPTSSDTVGRDAIGGDYSTYTWLPFIKLRQMTATNHIQQVNLVGGGSNNPAVATSLAAATAGTPNSGPVGSVWRVTFTVAGTNPSFGSLIMAINFIP